VTANFSLDINAVLDAAVSHAMALGLFERVNGHEPKNAPGSGLTAAVWVDYIGPHAAQSGLAATSARLVLNVRAYTSMLADPQDAIDPRVVAAVGALMGEYSGDFDFGGAVESVDLLGRAGPPMSAQAGYLNQDQKLYRVMTITVPVIVNDVWTQGA
jgi:hypothetical protein